MRVILSNGRYFVAETGQDVFTVALRLLNEQRTITADESLKGFLDDVTEAQDGPTAVALAHKLFGFQVFPAETV